MPGKYLIDSCVWIDFYDARKSREGKPFGRYAASLFSKIISEGGRILFSRALAGELRKNYAGISSMLKIIAASGSLVFISTSASEAAEAKILSEEGKIPFVDCLNAVQARNHGALLVTQDRHFFSELENVAKCARPQDIISGRTQP